MLKASKGRLPVVGISGWKNSGKTTLVVALVRELVGRGLRVSTLKHAHHAFDIDLEGKDSYLHRSAGASEVLVASDQRWALMHELRGTAAPTLDELVSHLAPCDLVLAEGFKTGRHPKIEVARDAGRPLIAASDPTVLAVVTNEPTIRCDRPIFHADDTHGIADFLLRRRPDRLDH